MLHWKRIIKRMLELYTWSWRIFLPMFASFSLGSIAAYIGKQHLIALISLLLAMICLIIGVLSYIKCIREARRKDREEKAREESKRNRPLV